MKQIAALMIFMLAALGVFALILRIGAAISGHRGGGMAFVVARNSAPATDKVSKSALTLTVWPLFDPLRH
jgi:hypothetical protein